MEDRKPKIMAEKPAQPMAGAVKQGPLQNTSVPTKKPTVTPLDSKTRGPRD